MRYIQSGLEHVLSSADYVVYFYLKLKLQIWIKTEMLMKNGKQWHNYCRDALDASSNWILDQIHVKQNNQHCHLKSPTS